MNQRRVAAVLLFFFGVSFCLVHLEGKKIRYARQISVLNGQLLELDYQQWQARARLAKLCSPAHLRQRSASMPLETIAPKDVVDPGVESSEQLAVGLLER